MEPNNAHPDQPPTRRGDTALSWALHGLVVAGAAGAVAIDRKLRRSTRVRAEIATPIVAAAFYGVLWAVESRRPHRQQWRPVGAEVRTDAAFLASVLATQAATTAMAAPLTNRIGPNLGVGRLPLPVGVIMAVVAFDLGHSRLHQLSHRWGPAWRVHSVHHSPTRLYWFNATRFHIAEMAVDMTMEAVVLAVLGLNRDQHIAYQAVRSMYGQLQHSNIEMRSGVLDHVLSTPDLHRWHHSTVYDEGDSNYGAVTSVWDRVFGTWFRPTQRRGPDELGVGRMPNFPERFWELERVPLDWDLIRQRNAATWEPTTAAMADTRHSGAS